MRTSRVKGYRIIFRLKRFIEIEGETVDLYEAIKSGKKTSEWRNASSYWTRIFFGSNIPESMCKECSFEHLCNGQRGDDCPTLDFTKYLRGKMRRAWFIVGFPKDNLPRLEADITAVLYHPRTNQFEIKFKNVVEIMVASHDQLPNGKHFKCPKSGLTFHCAYCHRVRCAVCSPCEGCALINREELGRCQIYLEWEKNTRKRRAENKLHTPFPKCEVTKAVLNLFNEAERFLIENGFEREIEWCDHRPDFEDLGGNDFLREYAWVVFNSGMRNSVISAKWEALKKAFHYFIVPYIVENENEVMRDALNVFGNYKKVVAVIDTARKIHKEGYFKTIKPQIRADSIHYLSQLPFIGKVTKYHLARNLGFDYIKPDRHLVRLAKKFDITPEEMCNIIHNKTGRRLGTIDVILWRFCEQKGQMRLR